MSVHVIGMIQSQKQSEIHPASGPAVDRDYVRAFARAHESAGFDRILVPHHSTGPSAPLTIAVAAEATERIHFMLAHRPGFVAPTLAAREIATLDQFTGGRLGVHIISGGSDSEQRRDGDYLSHDERYARTDEYLGLLRRLWTADAPFDHAGTYYQFEAGYSEVKPAQRPYVPLFFGGASEPALDVAARHADIYASWGESLAQVRELTTRVRSHAANQGRSLRFSVSFRVVLADTEARAWARADAILAKARALREAAGLAPGGPQQSEGARRLLATAAQGERVDERLWTGIAQLTGARFNATALVGTPEQVAQSLLAYYALGVDTFLLRGFDPLEDAVDYGRELIPRLRDLTRTHDTQHRRAA